MDGINEFVFTPASEFKDRHGLFIALVGGTNSGKTYSALRLAKGIADAQGKRVAVLDTEGGRTLHLKEEFDFDVRVLEPPHRPQRYLHAAQSAQARGYGCMVVDSFSMEWRGPGGKLDWTDEELEKFVARKRADAEAKNWNFDEVKTRLAGKAAASIEPSMAHKMMEFGFLQLRMPIIFAIRGAETYDPDKRQSVFKAQCRRDFLFDVTVSFKLAQDKKGIIDLTDAKTWKMEGAHAAIFKDGEQLSERHGELVNAWATNASLPEKEDKARKATDALIALARAASDEESLLNAHTGDKERQQLDWLKAKRPELYKEVNDAVAAKLAELQKAASQSSPSLPTSSKPDGDADGGQQASDPPEASVGGDSKSEAIDRPVGFPEDRWALPAGIVGQDAKMAAIRKLLAGKAKTSADVDDLKTAHADFIAKLGSKRAGFEREFGDRKAVLEGPL